MTIRRLFLSILLGGGLVAAQEPQPEPKPEPKAEESKEEPKEAAATPAETITFTDQEIQNFLDTFDQTYKNKDLPQDDAVATLANLKNAYAFLKAKGDAATKEQIKLRKDIVERVAKKGLTARKRPIVNIECAKVLGELGDPDGSAPLIKWLETELEEKNPSPQAVEYGFMSLALIGLNDKVTLEFVLDYASKGKHQDSGVAAQAIRACYYCRELDGKTRKEFFDKICMYLQGLHSKAKGGDPKQRGTYEQRYKAVETDGLECLKELSTDGTKFDDPDKAREWFNENKKHKWDKYVGKTFRGAAAPAKKEGEEPKPEG